MRIKWFGQSSFLITTDAGTRILIDPFDRMLGYKMPKPIEVDMVAVTHNHSDHNKIHVASGNYLLVNEPKEFSLEDVSVKGIKTYHDKANGKRRGPNNIFRFEIDGLKVCHCGDLGHLLTDEQVRAIGEVDLLMVPVGGRTTINAGEAVQVMHQLKAKVAIPMHYSTKALGILGRILFEKVDKFTQAAGVPTTEVALLNVNSETLPNYSGVIVMDYL
ncbi:MBL fold metallo-hydrolase [Pullulanibacillus sp. KACC 23026]|uniref:MBL fold metallo-hydrolase n=1 Tax=Pullulanibacillus sp. KACC 23026 TaxID=3028315 RepID=UPI0023B1A793|nr:MBL fold metallo-hydrolase [Pullulanibacillus sp. KACC 23026]WEG13191.1 MBL fold metallo-hydrolase [Pullulanibacillus sp. KACC 23026]